MANFTQSDPFIHKDCIDVLQSFKGIIGKQEPTVWLFADTKMTANTIRASLCRYKNLGLLPKDFNVRVVEIKKPVGVMIYPK